jgi:anti-sigma factor RsiW
MAANRASQRSSIAAIAARTVAMSALVAISWPAGVTRSTKVSAFSSPHDSAAARCRAIRRCSSTAMVAPPPVNGNGDVRTCTTGYADRDGQGRRPRGCGDLLDAA